jgi:hypothetical protein
MKYDPPSATQKSALQQGLVDGSLTAKSTCTPNRFRGDFSDVGGRNDTPHATSNTQEYPPHIDLGDTRFSGDLNERSLRQSDDPSAMIAERRVTHNNVDQAQNPETCTSTEFLKNKKCEQGAYHCSDLCEGDDISCI